MSHGLHGSANRESQWIYSLTETTQVSPWARIGRWVMNVFCLDAILPICVNVLPRAVSWLFPRQRLLIDLLAVAVPIGAFFYRVAVGKRHIDGNACGRVIRFLQYITLGAGALMLILIDSFVIAMIDLPAVAPRANEAESNLLLYISCAYFLSMTFAMYPGFRTLTQRYLLENRRRNDGPNNG